MTKSGNRGMRSVPGCRIVDHLSFDVDNLRATAGAWLALLGERLGGFHVLGDDFDPSLQTVFNDRFDAFAEGGNQQAEADRISEEARGKEDGAGDENHEAIHDFLVGQFALGQSQLVVVERLETLRLGQVGADEGGENNNAKSGKETDFFAQGNKDRQFRDGNEDKEEQEFGEHGYRMVLEAGSDSDVQFQILHEG